MAEAVNVIDGFKPFKRCANPVLSAAEGFKPFRRFQSFEPPISHLPRVAGEEKGGGLNGAQRLNGTK